MFCISATTSCLARYRPGWATDGVVSRQQPVVRFDTVRIGRPDESEGVGSRKQPVVRLVPPSLGALTLLLGLDLANNQLSGSIPPSLGALTLLLGLDLANNRLSGSIPSALTRFARTVNPQQGGVWTCLPGTMHNSGP